MPRPSLVADIGATTTRLALAGAGGKLDAVRTYANDEVGDLETLLAEALGAAGRRRPKIAVLGVAGPIDNDRVTVINRGWTFSRRMMRRALGLERLVVVNDFAALAHALPLFRPADLLSLGPLTHAPPKERLLVCGPGSGFGSALLISDSRRPRVLTSEAGHMRLGAATADEARVIAHFLRASGPVIVEHVLSGSGLARLHEILSGARKSSEAVAAAARAGEPAARATAELFLRLFGRIAGDLALAYNAKAVYLAGGVVLGLARIVPTSPFREAFAEHPPYKDRLDQIPVQIVLHEQPGLLGAAAIARRLS